MQINGNALPLDIVGRIIKQTDGAIQLTLVCKAFANVFFPSFLEKCQDNQELKQILNQIDLNKPDLTIKAKINNLYNTLINTYPSVVIDDKEDISKAFSIEPFNHLEQGIRLWYTFTEAKNAIEDCCRDSGKQETKKSAEELFESLKGKSTKEKIEDMDSWLEKKRRELPLPPDYVDPYEFISNYNGDEGDYDYDCDYDCDYSV